METNTVYNSGTWLNKKKKTLFLIENLLSFFFFFSDSYCFELGFQFHNGPDFSLYRVVDKWNFKSTRTRIF